MEQAAGSSTTRVYWVTWGVLLVVTLIMLVLDSASLARPLLVALLLSAMAVKAVLIAGHFMHLRHEHRGLIWTVVLGLFAMGVLLYALIVPDAIRIHEMAAGR